MTVHNPDPATSNKRVKTSLFAVAVLTVSLASCMRGGTMPN